MIGIDNKTPIGTTAPAGARRPFSIDQLVLSSLFSDEENLRRKLAMHAYFGWQSVSVLEEEFATTVGPFYEYLSHHHR